MKIEIDLTEEEKLAIDDMLGSQFTLESYIKNLASTHIVQNIDKVWNKKTYEEKIVTLDKASKYVEPAIEPIELPKEII